MNSAGKRKGWIIIGLLAASFLFAYTWVLFSFRAESALELRGTDDAPQSTDHVFVQLDILEIDPVLQKVWFRLTPEPGGALRENNFPVPSQTLTFRIRGARVSLGNALTESRTEAVFAESQYMSPVDAVTVLTNGSVGSFPFDDYLFSFGLSVIAPDAASPEGYRSVPIIVEPSPDAGLAGYTFSGEVTRVSTHNGAPPDAVELNVTVRRSPAAYWYTILLMVIAGALALGCTAVAVVVAFDPRYIQPAFFAWMSATLFAIVGLRRLLPGNPPFGSLPDFLVFMWAEILVTLSLISLIVSYLRRKPQP